MWHVCCARYGKILFIRDFLNPLEVSENSLSTGLHESLNIQVLHEAQGFIKLPMYRDYEKPLTKRLRGFAKPALYRDFVKRPCTGALKSSLYKSVINPKVLHKLTFYSGFAKVLYAGVLRIPIYNYSNFPKPPICRYLTKAPGALCPYCTSSSWSPLSTGVS